MELAHAEKPSLRPHQRVGSDWLKTRYRALVCDPPGCGKTAQAIVAAVEFGTPVAVVCPAVAVGVWVAELSRFAPQIKVRVQTEQSARRKPKIGPLEPPWVAAPGPGEWVITTYDRALFASAAHKYGVILDESHLIKSNKTHRYARIAQLIRAARGFVWALTGTPILRDPDDLWRQLEALGVHKQLYRTQTAFRTAFGGVWRAGDMKWGKIHANAWKPLEPLLLRRDRETLVDLPERTNEVWVVDLKAKDAAYFEAIAREYPDESPDWEQWASAGELAVALSKLSLAKASLAVGPIRELAPSTDRPIVVFTAHRAAAKLLAEELKWPTITGSTSTNDRSRIAAEFQDGKHCGVVCTIQAAGLALTLTRASTSVFVSRTWVNAQNSQAEDRLYRIGQTREVRTVIVRANSALEKSVDRVLARKAKYDHVPEVAHEQE